MRLSERDTTKPGVSTSVKIGVVVLVCLLVLDVALVIIANNQARDAVTSTVHSGAPAVTKQRDEDLEEKEEPADDATGDDAGKPSEDPQDKSEAPEEDAQPAGDGSFAAALNATCASVSAESGMRTSLAVIDLGSGTQAGYEADRSMVSASMIKLIVAEAFLQKVQEGAYALDAVYTLKAQDIVGGTGVLAGRGAGAQVSYRELLERMIDASDNVAANVLIDATGMDAINAEAQRLGLTGTNINRRMMDTNAIAAGVENYVSANDIAKLLRMVYDGTFVNAQYSGIVMQALQNQQDVNGILAGLPQGTSFAHKTGTLTNARHDGGIVMGTHPYVLVVLCQSDPIDEGAANAVMARAASLVNADIEAHAA